MKGKYNTTSFHDESIFIYYTVYFEQFFGVKECANILGLTPKQTRDAAAHIRKSKKDFNHELYEKISANFLYSIGYTLPEISDILRIPKSRALLLLK